MKNGVTVFGSFITDLMGRCERLPIPGETVKGDFYKISAGGKGSNQAVAAKRAGANVDMVTKVGRDQFSSLAFESFEKEGISTDHIFLDDEESTGVALIMVDERTGENMINVIPGASFNMTEDNIESARDIILKNEILLLQLETNIDAILKVIDIAYENGIKTILNPAPVSDLPDDIYKKLYAITPNETEIELLSGIEIKEDEDVIRACNYFHDKGLKNVIVTLGKKGAYISTEDVKEWLEPIKVEVVDTTGAGDAFNGGLVAGLSSGKSILDSCRYAMVVAGLSVTKLGTSISMPNLEEIGAYMENRG